jgi:hypothetical protein
MKLGSLAFAALLALNFTPAVSFAQSNGQPARSGSESLGGELLQGLDATPATVQPGAADAEQPAIEVDPRLKFRPPVKFDDLGEDLGAPSGPLPLVRARQGMQQAGALLAQQGSMSDVRATQQQVVSQLDELINSLCKQCQGGNCPPSDKPPKPGQPKPGAKAGTKPGTSAIGQQNSPDAVQPRGADATSPAEREEMIKRLWGHLPERSREQMMQSFSNEFLPKYELELEKYYRRLAEEPAGDDR